MCGRRDADSGYRLQTDRTPENKMSVEFHANSGFTIAYFNMSYWIIEGMHLNMRILLLAQVSYVGLYTTHAQMQGAGEQGVRTP